MEARPCVGFGKYEARCQNQATASPFIWCERCEKLRRAHIDGRMKQVSREFEARSDV